MFFYCKEGGCILTTSLAYKKAIKDKLRKWYCNIVLGVVDTTALDDFTVDHSEVLSISEPEKVARFYLQKPYATAEEGRFILNDSQYVASRDKDDLEYQGFVSKEMSYDPSQELPTWGELEPYRWDEVENYPWGNLGAILGRESGRYIFKNNPFLELNFNNPHTTKGLTFTFDNILDIYPKIIKIKLYSGQDIIFDKEFEINSAEFELREDLIDFTRIHIEWIEMRKPNQRARLTHILFGINLVFRHVNSDIINANNIYEIDPIMRRLPTNTFNFSIFNKNDRYDIDSPEGLWSFIKTKCPVFVEYGIETADEVTWGDALKITWGDGLNGTWWNITEQVGKNDRYIEYVNSGRNYLLEVRPKVDDSYVHFSCTDVLGSLTDDFFKSMNYIDGIALYDLAVLVMEDAGLNRQQYYVDESLKNIITTSYMPKQSHKDCLKMIAQACCCIVFTDRYGVVRLQPNSEAIYDNYHLGAVDLKGTAPTVEDSLELKDIELGIFTYTLDSEITDLGTSEINAGTHYRLGFPNAENVTYTTTGAIENLKIYGGAASFDCTKTGAITFSGQKINIDNKNIIIKNSETGETEPINNPLLTSQNNAEKVAAWYRNYLNKGNTYYFNYRGDPALESNDKISIKTKFTDKMPVRMLRQNLVFSGGLSGSAIAKID